MKTLIDRRQSQMLIVDMQERLLPAIADAELVLKGCQRLTEAARRLGVPITVSEQYPQGLGTTVPGLNLDATVLEKIEFSCTGNPALRDHLWRHRAEGRHHVVIAGIEAHVCVLQTAIDLSAEGADVFVVADAVGSRSVASAQLALERMRQAGVVVVNTEMVLFEWLQRADTPEFKDLLSLIKQP
jgi:nicotinamidase-related amidase